MSGTTTDARPSPDQSTIVVPINREQEQKIISTVLAYQNSLYSIFSLRGELENIDRQYMRERDWTDDQIKSRLANRRGDVSKIQDVNVPVIMPQVNSALTYLTNVYLTGYPIFPVAADPANADAALQMESIIQENVVTANWVPELLMFFRDGLKYNLHALECDWGTRSTWTVDNDLKSSTGVAPRKVLWQGNKIKRMDLYNTFWDPRVHPCDMHTQGEFAGYTEIYSRVRFKAFCNALFNQASKSAVVRALESGPIQGAVGASMNAPYGYYLPRINPFPFYNKGASIDWLNWASNTPMNSGGVNYTNAYSVTKVYVRILPSDYDFNVPEKNTPQVWKFYIVNGQVVLLAERLTNIHEFLPIFFGQPIQDGLDYQTKSYAQNVEDMQSIATALWRGYIASKRRLVGDRVLYDPSRISEKNINDTNPAAKIPVRPSAYGKPLGEAVYQFPFRDEQTDSLITGSNLVVNMANLINGQNPAQQGQFVKGNKTRHEYEDIMGHGNGQNQMLALSTEYNVMVPLKECIKLNILQYQQPGEIYNQQKQVQVTIKPEELRKYAVHFKVGDGMLPTDKLVSSDMLQVALQQLGAQGSPIAAEYNAGDIFSYLMKTQGMDLSPFKKSAAQLLYEQQLNAWQQAAAAAFKAGVDFNIPQPQPSPELVQEMQQKQQGVMPAGLVSQALESTQGR